MGPPGATVVLSDNSHVSLIVTTMNYSENYINFKIKEQALAAKYKYAYPLKASSVLW